MRWHNFYNGNGCGMMQSVEEEKGESRLSNPTYAIDMRSRDYGIRFDMAPNVPLFYARWNRVQVDNG